MRKSNRTTKCRNLLLILYINRLHSTSSRSYFNPKLNRNSQFSNSLPHNTTLAPNMIQQHFMTSMHNSIHNQNTTVRSSSVITKSPRRSPNCRLHNLSSDSPKTRRLWYDTSLYNSRPPNKILSLPIHHTLIMRHNHN